MKLDADSLLVAQNFNGILANKSFGKGKLVLFPVGPVAVVKEVKASMLTMTSPWAKSCKFWHPSWTSRKAQVAWFHISM